MSSPRRHVSAPPLNERRLLLTLAVVQFTHILDFMIMMPLGPQFMRVFGINPHQFSLLVSSYAFSAGISGLAASFFLDRFDRKHALLTLYSGFALGTLACAVAPSYGALLAARILTGAFSGVGGSVVFAIVGDAVPAARRGRAMGLVMSAFSAAQVLGLPLGLSAAQHFSWHAPFLIIVVCALVVLLVAGRILPSLRLHHHHGVPVSPVRQIRHILGARNHLVAFALSGLLTLASSLVIPFLSPAMVFNVHMTEDHLDLIYLCGGFATIFSMNYIGHWADRHGKFRAFAIMALVSILPVLVVTHLGPVPLWEALAVSTIFIVTMSGRFVPASAMITGAVVARYRGGFSSISAASQQICQGLGTYAAGLLVYQPVEQGRLEGYANVGYLSVGIVLISLVLARRLQPADEAPAAGTAPGEFVTLEPVG